MRDIGKNERISSVSIGGASQCGARRGGRGPTWSETMDSPRANVVSLRRRRFTVLRLLLFLVGTLQACWLSAAPGDQGDSLTQLSLEELGNIKVTSVSKEPEQVWKTPAAVYVITQDDILALGSHQPSRGAASRSGRGSGTRGFRSLVCGHSRLRGSAVQQAARVD